MNEQLLKFVYDGSEKDGFALVGAQYKALVDELVDSELVEIDPAGAQPDGSYRVTVTEDGIKWVEAGQATAKVIAETATPPAPSRPRGRPRKAVAMEVIPQGPVEVIEEQLVDEPLPFTLPTMTNTQRLSEPLDGRPFEVGDSRAPVPAWADKVAQQPAPFVSPFERKEMSDQHGLLAINAPAWSRPPVQPFQPFNGPQTSPIEEEYLHRDEQHTPQPLAEAFKPLIEAEKPVEGPLRPRREMNGDIVRTVTLDRVTETVTRSSGCVFADIGIPAPSVGITTHLLPPTKRVRIKAEDRLAPWPQFAQMPVYGQFYLTDEQVADGFDDVLKTANRVYGKQTPAKTFQMFEAKKVQNANTTVGFFVFRMS